MKPAKIAAIAFIFALVLASTSYAFYFGGFGGGRSYSNYAYSSNAYYPTGLYSTGYSRGYYGNPFGAYYGYSQRSSASFLFRSW